MYLFKHETIRGMDMYQQVYDICTARQKPYAGELLQGIFKMLLEYSKVLNDNIMGHEDVVAAYAAEWSRFRIASGYCDRVCDFLNRYCTRKAPVQRISVTSKSQIAANLTVEGVRSQFVN